MAQGHSLSQSFAATFDIGYSFSYIFTVSCGCITVLSGQVALLPSDGVNITVHAVVFSSDLEAGMALLKALHSLMREERYHLLVSSCPICCDELS